MKRTVHKSKRKLKSVRKKLNNLRLLAFSDCRSQNIPEFIRWISSQSPFDLIIYAGDDIKRFRPSPQINYFEQLAALSKFGIVAVVGNDDEPYVRGMIKGKNVYEIHSQPLKIDNFLFVGNEGALDLGYTVYTERQFKRHLDSIIPKRTNKKIILVSHIPPFDCLDMSLRYGVNSKFHNIGSKEVRKIIQNRSCVSLVICGHSHFSGGKKEILAGKTIVNVASHDNIGEPLRFATINLSLDGTVVTELLKYPDREMKIRGIGPQKRYILTKLGIKNTRELSESSPTIICNALKTSSNNAEMLISLAKAQIFKKPFIIQPIGVPIENRIYLDIETNRDQSTCWLIGVCTDTDNRIVQFRAEEPNKEQAMLQSFIDFVLLHQNHSILHYSSNNIDKNVLQKRMQFYNLAVPLQLESSTNIYMKLSKSIALPIHNYSLYYVSKYCGYKYKYPSMDGLVMLSIYEKALSEGNTIPESLFNKNSDDVFALRHLVHNILAIQKESVTNQSLKLTAETD